MGNRLLKESICKSDQIDELSWFEEVFFYRLLVNCDDYGVMDARLKILKSDMFPLKDISLDQIAEALDKIIRIGLVQEYRVKGKPYVQVIKWADHQRVRDSKHKYPTPDASCGDSPEAAESCGDPGEDENTSEEGRRNLRQVAASCGELRQNAEKSGSRARPRAGAESESESISESISESLLSDADAAEIREDHDRVLNAAEDAGFKMSNNVRAALIALYAEHGREKVLEGLRSCSDHGAPNLAYLKACLKGEPRREKPAKTVPAQQYTQRDYGDEDAEAMKRMLKLAASG